MEAYSKQLKILHICAGVEIGDQSGVPNYVRGVASSQSDLGHDVVVFARGSIEGDYGYRLESYNSKLKPPYLGSLNDDTGLLKLESLLTDEGFDLVHVHMAMDLGRDLARILRNVPYVVSLHDYWFICPRINMMASRGEHPCDCYCESKCENCISYLERFKICRGVYKLVMNRIVPGIRHVHLPQSETRKRYKNNKELLEHASLVLPVSNRVLEIFENSGIHANYRTLHIGSASANTFPAIQDVRGNGQRINLVFMGNLTYWKGGDLLLRIAESVDKQRFKIHFFGVPGEYEKKLRASSIVDHGPYRQENISSVLQGMDMGLVLPIWEDNGPQVAIEMLNNRIPVISSKMGGLPDFINDRTGYLFDPYDDDSFDAMIRFLNSLTEETIMLMKEAIVPTKTIEEHAQELMALYQTIVV